MIRPSLSLLSAFLLAAFVLHACRPSVPPVDQNGVMTQAVQTAFASIRQTQAASQPASTRTPEPVPVASRTPPTLPPVFTTTALNPLDTPHTYIRDTCQYLRDRWNPANATPGTVVMIIMFHSISEGAVDQPYQISAADFRRLLNDLKEQGFEAIHTRQLADFMERNARIPPRSVLLLVDDRHHAEYFNTHFRPFYERWGWPVVNAYIAKDERPDLWQENAALEAEGWVDHQAHGVIHNVNIVPGSSEEFMLSELQGAIANIQKYFGKTPIAYIWPGGGFTPRAVQLARQVGYRLGFTINPRGPVMYNWVPLADVTDSARPYFLAEGAVEDPLMVLPRYTDTAAGDHIDTVRIIGQEAAAYAEQNKRTELEYYNIVCAPTYGPIP